jgi:hypothetical protein
VRRSRRRRRFKGYQRNGKPRNASRISETKKRNPKKRIDLVPEGPRGLKKDINRPMQLARRQPVTRSEKITKAKLSTSVIRK